VNREATTIALVLATLAVWAALLQPGCVTPDPVEPTPPVVEPLPDPPAPPPGLTPCEQAHLRGVELQCRWALDTPDWPQSVCALFAEAVGGLRVDPACMSRQSTCQAMTECRGGM